MSSNRQVFILVLESIIGCRNLVSADRRREGDKSTSETRNEKMSLNKQFDISEEDTQRVLVLFQQFHPLNVWSKVKKEDFTMKRFE